MNSLIEAHQLVELGNLEDIFTEMGYQDVQLHEKSSKVPYHTLLVGLDTDAKSRAQVLALTFYPVTEFEGTLFLQYFIELPFVINPAHLPDLCQLLAEINNKMVVGHFGLSEGEQKLHFRYVQAIIEDEVLTQEHVENVATLVTFSPKLFADVLESVANGELSLTAARTKINKN